MNGYSYKDVKNPLVLELAKPNRQIVGRLKHIDQPKHSIKWGQLNEIKFTVPYYITKNFNRIVNPTIDQLKSLYHVRASNGVIKEEWYVISRLEKARSEDGKDTIGVTLTSLGYLLRNKKIPTTWAGVLVDGEYRKESLNAYQVLNELLSDTAWDIEYIDAKFITKFRSFDFSNTSVLDAVFEVANKFGGLIEWDTVNRRISLIDNEKVGINKGVTLSEGKYLKSLNFEEQSDEIVTRLYVYGQDGISIHKMNPLGVGYLEDFSYFMQGFERDSNKRVISSSPYMSDELCSALLDYQEVIKRNDGSYSSLVTQRDNYEKQLASLETDLFKLETDLKKVEDEIDVKQTNNQDASEAISRRNSLQSQISSIKGQISSLESSISQIEFSIEQLSKQLSMTTHFTPELLLELDNYILEDVWEDTNYTDEKELYEDSKKVFAELNKPKTTLTVNIVNIYEILGKENATTRLGLGDKFNIKHPQFDIYSEAQLIEFEIDYDNYSISITIANVKDASDKNNVLKIIYDSISTSKTVDMSKFTWDKVNELDNDVTNLINSNWDAAKNEINAGVNNTVTINERGVTLSDSDVPNKFIRMTNGVIGLTEDGGDTFKTAITPRGITAEYLVGKVLIGNNLYLENQGKFRFDQDGVTIDGTALTITNGGLRKSQLDPSFADSLFELDKTYTNGIRMDSESGIVVTRSDDKAAAYFNATDGFKFKTKTGTVWKDSFYYDVNTNRVVLNGELNALDIKIGGKSVLTTDDLIKGSAIKSITTDQLVAGSAKISTAMIETLKVGKNVIIDTDAYISWGQISNKPIIPSRPEDIGALSTSSPQLTYIGYDGIYTGTISANKINGGTISGVRINVNTDLYVGDNIRLGGGGSSYRSVVFNGDQAYIYTDGYGLNLSTSGTLALRGATNMFYGSVDFSNARIYGLNYVKAQTNQDIAFQFNPQTGNLNVYLNGSLVGSVKTV